MAARSSGIPDDGAYRVLFSSSARFIASRIGSGVGMNGSPPSNWYTAAPWLRSSIMRLRSLTMSENPTSSSREARRSTVGEVVTVWIVSFRFVRGTADYSVAIGMPSN